MGFLQIYAASYICVHAVSHVAQTHPPEEGMLLRGAPQRYAPYSQAAHSQIRTRGSSQRNPDLLTIAHSQALRSGSISEEGATSSEVAQSGEFVWARLPPACRSSLAAHGAHSVQSLQKLSETEFQALSSVTSIRIHMSFLHELRKSCNEDSFTTFRLAMLLPAQAGASLQDLILGAGTASAHHSYSRLTPRSNI